MIDPKAAKAVGQIVVGGSLEFAAPDGKGRLFVNAEDKNEIVAVDLVAMKVVAHYPMSGCMRPTGLAYVEGHRLISSCQSVAKIIDATNGHEIATLPIGIGPDAVIYDSCPLGRLRPFRTRRHARCAIALAGSGNNTVVDTVPTKAGARTGTVDAKTGKVYLPSADYAPTAAQASARRRRRGPSPSWSWENERAGAEAIDLDALNPITSFPAKEARTARRPQPQGCRIGAAFRACFRFAG